MVWRTCWKYHISQTMVTVDLYDTKSPKVRMNLCFPRRNVICTVWYFHSFEAIFHHWEVHAWNKIIYETKTKQTNKKYDIKVFYKTWQQKNLWGAEIHMAVSQGSRGTYSMKLSIMSCAQQMLSGITCSVLCHTAKNIRILNHHWSLKLYISLNSHLIMICLSHKFSWNLKTDMPLLSLILK